MTLINNADPNVVNAYFRWLCKLVSPAKSEEYSLLFHDLHNREFYYIIDKDENRAGDGKYLRYEFGEDAGIDNAELILSGPCSIFEMLIALASRADGSASLDLVDKKSIQKYFWIFMENLGLKEATNQYYDSSEVQHILDRWMFREYDSDDTETLFPGSDPDEEIWFQMQKWMSQIDEKSGTFRF